jgi:hypothetical protein
MNSRTFRTILFWVPRLAKQPILVPGDTQSRVSQFMENKDTKDFVESCFKNPRCGVFRPGGDPQRTYINILNQ